MTTTKNPFRFCVYAYLRSKDSTTGKKGTVFYVGKGQGNRPYAKHGRFNFTPKDVSNIVIMEDNLSEIGAFALERFYIRWYGKQCDASGFLINLTDGGEGCSGRIPTKETRTKISEKQIGDKNHRYGKVNSIESNEKRSASLTGQKRSEETKKVLSEQKIGDKNPMYGKKVSDETKEKMSVSRSGENNYNYGKKASEDTIEKMRIAQTGKKHSEETKMKMSASRSGANSARGMLGKKASEETLIKLRMPKGQQKIVTCPHCNTEGGVSAMTRYHFDNCKLKPFTLED